MLIEFLDKEKLSLTENSLVYIDDTYYDPDPSLSKMSIRMARGTASFASVLATELKTECRCFNTNCKHHNERNRFYNNHR